MTGPQERVMTDDFVTTGEFSRWRSDFQAFQARLSEELRQGFQGINLRLDELNGRTRKNSETIVQVATEVDEVKDDVSEVRQHGCAQLVNHQVAMVTPSISPDFQWTRRHTGITAGASAVVLAVIEILQHLLGIK